MTVAEGVQKGPPIVKGVQKGPPIVKDKGYAWLVLAMSILSHMVHVGFSSGVIGNLTVAQKHQFHISLEESTLIGTVHRGCLCLSGPLSSALLQTFGCRGTQLIGALFTILGLSLLYFATQAWHAYILFGIVTAFGLSSCYMATTNIIAVYFNKYKNLAFAATALGTYVGWVMWPIVSQYLLTEFGYSKAMGIMSTFHVIHIIAGISFCEPSAEVCDQQASPSTSMLEHQRAEGDLAARDKVDGDDVDQHIIDSDANADLRENSEDWQATVKEDLHGGNCIRKLISSYKKVLKCWKVRAIMLNGMLWAANASSFLILVNDFMLHRLPGATNYEVDLGVSVLGISNLAGCLLVVLVGTLSFDRLILHCAMPLVFGGATIASAFCKDKVIFYSLAAVYGATYGAFIANLVATLCTFGTPQSLAVLLGLLLVSEGVGTLALGSFSDYLAKHTLERYGIIFAGCLGILSSLCILPVVISRIRRRKQRKLYLRCDSQ